MKGACNRIVDKMSHFVVVTGSDGLYTFFKFQMKYWGYAGPVTRGRWIILLLPSQYNVYENELAGNESIMGVKFHFSRR